MKKRGFTIIELLVTITLIGLMLGVASIYFSNAQRNGRDTTRLSDVSLIGQAIDETILVLNGIPPALSDCANRLPTTYINTSLFPARSIPVDPRPLIPVVTLCTSAAYGYYYVSHTTSGTNDANLLGRKYVIEVGLENKEDASNGQFQTRNSMDSSKFASGTDVVLTTSGSRYVYILPGPLMP